MQAIITADSTQLAQGRNIDELFTRWIRFLDVKPRTVETYRKAGKQFFLFLQANGIENPGREDVLRYKGALQAAGRKPATINMYLLAVRRFYEWTEAEGLLPNITKGVKALKLDRRHKKDYLTSNQAKNLLQTVGTDTQKGMRDFAILALMVTTGLRTIEVQRANVEDMRTRGDGVVLYLQGKGRDDKQEFVKLSDLAERAITDYLKSRGKTAAGDPLFASSANRNHGGRMTTRSISRICKQNLVEAVGDSDRLTAHSLRHTAATLNLLNGGTLEETQGLLRHHDPATTMIYIHELSTDKNNSAQRITDAIFG